MGEKLVKEYLKDILLIIAEIERVAAEQNLYKEESLLEPDDEGYVPLTEE